MRRYLVLANPHAGGVEREAHDAAVGVLSAAAPTEVHMATDLAARVGFAAALRAGTHLDRDDVHHLRGTRVRVSGEPVRHNVDGELDAEATDRGYLVLPGAWSLLVLDAAGS